MSDGPELVSAPAIAAPRPTLSQRAFDRWSAFCSRRAALALMFCWSFAESLVWPLIPDVLLIPLVFGRPDRYRQSLATCIAGSMLGAVTLFSLATACPDQAAAILPHLPLIFEADIASVYQRIEQDGMSAFLKQPVSGIPFKVWGIVGAVSGLSPWTVLPVVLLARATRMAVLTALAVFLGTRFQSRVRNHWLIFVAIYVIVFVAGWIRTFPSAG